MLAVESALNSIADEPVDEFLESLSNSLATFDWRTAAAPGLTPTERTLKSAFRGSGGYRQLREHLLRHIVTQPGEPASAAAEVQSVLGYE